VVECDLAKVEVAGSNPVSRSRFPKLPALGRGYAETPAGNYFSARPGGWTSSLSLWRKEPIVAIGHQSGVCGIARAVQRDSSLQSIALDRQRHEHDHVVRWHS
jgi:hypothetical protein